MPFECWKKLKNESGKAYAAFCVFRDMEPAERSIKKAFESSNKESSYKQWCNYSAQFKWSERVNAFDRHNDKKKQARFQEKMEKRIDKQFEVTDKLLDLASKKLDIMNAVELTQNGVIEFTNTAIKWQREIGGFASANTESKQGEFNFEPEFQGL